LSVWKTTVFIWYMYIQLIGLKKCRILIITVLTLSNRPSIVIKEGGDDKLVLFLFPGIPTGDPAIVAFYDKRIYKKLRLKELSLSDTVRNRPSIVIKEGGRAYHDTVVYFVIFRCCFFP
jgi:hypothetical protein